MSEVVAATKRDTWLVFDATNMLYRSFYASKDESVDASTGLAIHTALTTLNKYYKKFRPTKVVIAFDRSSWRKRYTASDECISKRPYKGKRRIDMTPAQQEKYRVFLQHCADFEQLVSQYTTMTVLAGEWLEADDLIACVCQQYSSNDRDIIVLSADSDLWQLTQHPNVKVMSPASDTFQSLDEYGNDPLYYLFVKCIRGDPTDNIMSAYPRVRLTRIEKAFKDPYERTELMKEQWEMDGVSVTVEDVFRENQILIALDKQPDDIKRAMLEATTTAMSSTHKFSMLQMLKFLGKFKLQRIIDGIDNYVDLLGR